MAQSISSEAVNRTHIGWIDTVKGVGIALVVLGHQSIGPLAQSFIYLFHMPLFFFVSGYLHKPQSNFGRYLKKKSIHLLVPYVTFVVLTSVLMFLRGLHHGLTAARIEHGLFEAAWGGSQMTGLYGVLWFLTCLFLTQQLMNWLLVRYRMGTVAFWVCVAVVLSYVNSIGFPEVSLPLDANVVAAAMPFFLAGYLFRSYEPKKVYALLIGSIGLAFSLYLVFRGIPITYNMRDGIYGVPFVSLILSLSCILGFIEICKLLDSSRRIVKPLHGLGVMSMGIMFIHKELPVIPGHASLERHSVLLTFAVDLTVSYLLSVFIYRFVWGRALFFGSELEFKAVLQRLRGANAVKAETIAK
jgi:fucose 4-O-acetylase-like acetyltransferase